MLVRCYGLWILPNAHDGAKGSTKAADGVKGSGLLGEAPILKSILKKAH